MTMSLKTYVARPEVAARLRAACPASPPHLPALRVGARSNRYAHIGTAFDYFLRFDLRRRAPHAVARDWIADSVPDVFYSTTVNPGGVRASALSPEDLEALAPPGFQFANLETAKKLRERAAAILAVAHAAEEAHARSAAPTPADLRELARHALRLAMLDPVFREYRARPSTFAEPADEDVQELVELLGCVPFDQLVSPGAMLLNPIFGSASLLVGGADADLITGDLLVDFKVTIRGRVDPGHLDQVAGYLLLAREQRRLDPAAPEVRRVGVYYARQGYLWTADAEEWTGRPGFAEFEAWFIGRARELRAEEEAAVAAARRAWASAAKPSGAAAVGPAPPKPAGPKPTGRKPPPPTWGTVLGERPE